MMKKEERDAVLGDCMRGSVFTLSTNRLVQRPLRGYFQKEQHCALTMIRGGDILKL